MKKVKKGNRVGGYTKPTICESLLDLGIRPGG